MKNKTLIFLLSGLLTACAATPPTNFYLLEARNTTTVTPNLAITKKMLIGIGPLSLPALVNRKQIVTRQENNSIEMAEFHQWAEPLTDNVLSVLSKNITAQHPNAIIKAYPWSAYGNMDYHIIIDITRFDSQLGKTANFEASWAIMNEKDHSIIHNGQTNLQQSLHDASYQSVVLALNKLLNDFSEQLSLALHQVPLGVKLESAP